MHIQFNPLDPAEHKIVSAFLKLCGATPATVEPELPAGCRQTTVQEALAAEAATPEVKDTEGRPKRHRRTKAEIAADAAVEPTVGDPPVHQPQDISQAKTETLAIKAPVEPKVEEPKPAAPAVQPLFTKDEVRAAILGYADRNGQDKARQLMREVGKAEKLSDIQPMLYPDVLKACGA